MSDSDHRGRHRDSDPNADAPGGLAGGDGRQQRAGRRRPAPARSAARGPLTASALRYASLRSGDVPARAAPRTVSSQAPRGPRAQRIRGEPTMSEHSRLAAPVTSALTLGGSSRTT